MLRNRLRRRHRDAGFTLVETLMVMVMLSIMMGVAVTALVSVSRTEQRVGARTNAVDQARLAVLQIARQVRSGNVFYDPTQESTPLSMRVYTQANGDEKCVQWKIASGSLRVRSWTPTWSVDGQVSSWRTVATGLLNTQANGPVPFQLDSTSAYGSRLLNIDLLVDGNATVDATSTSHDIEIQDSVEGRNTEYGFSTSTCSSIPPG